jgi:hypothetical protein
MTTLFEGLRKPVEILGDAQGLNFEGLTNIVQLHSKDLYNDFYEDFYKVFYDFFEASIQKQCKKTS